LPELKAVLGGSAGLTVFRRLKVLDCLPSYTDRDRYYSVRETAALTTRACGSHATVWFSRYGTLVSTIESWSARGCFAGELADLLRAEVQDPLHDLARAERLGRFVVAGRFLYSDGRQPGFKSAPDKPRSQLLC